MKNSIVKVSSLDAVKKAVGGKKIGLALMCVDPKCEERLREETGAKVLNISEDKKVEGDCIVCGKKADYLGYVGKSY